MAHLVEITGKREDAEEFAHRAAEMTVRIHAVAWDGEWYRRGSGSKVIGSKKNAEARLFLNSQTWAVMAGVASPERARLAMDSVPTYLASEYGIKTVWPTFPK